MTKQFIGRYEIKKELGRGGMATVFRAYDPRFDRDVAIKLLAQHAGADDLVRQKFEAEAQLIAALEHNSIVPVYDYGTHDNRPYLVLRLMTGGTLADQLARGALSIPQVDLILGRICAALDKAHSKHIIHRDLKPANILLDEEGLPYLADFGIARLVDVTQTKTIIGTPSYMAPEQALGQPLSPQTDVYQMGVVLFEMLTGVVPFQAETPTAVVYQHVHEPIPRLSQLAPHVPPYYQPVLDTAMAKQAAQRPASAGALHTLFQQAPHSYPSAPKPAPATPKSRSKPAYGLWLGGTLLALTLVAGLFLVGQAFFSSNASNEGQDIAAQGVLPAPNESDITPSATATVPPTATIAPTLEPSATSTDMPTPSPAANGTAVPVNAPETTTIRPQDNQRMVYVPAGVFPMGLASSVANVSPQPDEAPVRNVTLDEFWIDETEITNAQFAAFLNVNGNRIAGQAGNSWLNLNDDFTLITESNGNYTPKSGADNLPVVMVTWYGAQAYCQWAGGALPTEAQWAYAARGPQGLLYPWGNAPDEAPLNFCDANCQYEQVKDNSFDDGFAQLAPVGSYPAGRSWVAALDMVGNAWEWTADWYGAYEATATTNPTGASNGDQKVLRGGSWGEALANARATIRQPYSPDARNGLIGFRCVVGEAVSDTAVDTTIPPVTLSNDTTVVHDTPQILIPAGEFQMGDNNGNQDEQPTHTVYLDAYSLDQTEVTNAQFAQFVAATGHQTTAEQNGYGWIYTGNWQEVPDANWRFPQGPNNGQGIDNHPVVQISWYDADAYCSWAGHRLPTEAEWEKAARGAEPRAYPWGNSFDGRRLNFCDANCTTEMSVDDGYAGTAPVGSYPDGASPYGVLDMAGNVFEWVADWYAPDYYANSPARNPTGPAEGQFKVLRGGAWRFSPANSLTTAREVSNPTGYNDNIGFRCAQD